MSGKDPKKLNEKQKRFVEEYLVDLNGKQAAIRAGYTPKTAEVQASRLLTYAKVAEYLVEIKAKRSERTEITADRVLKEMAKIGFSDLRKTLSNTGNLINPTDWDDDIAGAISSIEVVVRQSGEIDEDGNQVIEHVHKISTLNKTTALLNIGKHLGMFVDKTESKVSLTHELAPTKKLTDFLNGISKRGGETSEPE